VTDIFINRPGKVWLESLDGRIERIAVPDPSHAALERLVRQIANLSHQGINREHPLLYAPAPTTFGTRKHRDLAHHPLL